MTAQPRPLADLGHRDCRWPVNDATPPALHLFCGERAAEGKPYCTSHLAYRFKGQDDE